MAAAAEFLKENIRYILYIVTTLLFVGWIVTTLVNSIKFIKRDPLIMEYGDGKKFTTGGICIYLLFSLVTLLGIVYTFVL